MHSMRRDIAPRLPHTLTAAATMLALCGSASAQCNAYRPFVPDFDQRRQDGPGVNALPGNGGSHCAPTSSVDWMAYLANRGYPALMTGSPENWQLQQHYNFVTAAIGIMGWRMSTVVPGGTGHNGQINGMQEHLDAFYPGKFVVSGASMDGMYAPSPSELAEALNSGGLVVIGTSRWQFFGADPILGYPSRYVLQSGGHAVALTTVIDGCSVLPRIGFRDPAGADTEPRIDQSTFSTKYCDMEPITWLFSHGYGSPDIFQRTMYRFNCDGTEHNGSFSALKAYRVIKPLFGLSHDSATTLTMHGAWDPDSGEHLGPQSIIIPGGGTIIDFDLMPSLSAAIAVVENNGDYALWRVTYGSGSAAPLGPIDQPGAFTLSPHGELFMCGDRSVRRIEIRNGAAEPGDSMPLPATPAAIAYNDEHDTIALLLPAVQKVREAAARLNSFVDIDLPSNLVIDGEACIAVDPDGTSYYIGSANGGVWKVTNAAGAPPAATLLNIPGADSLRCLQVDHRGHLRFTSNGVFHEVALDPADGEWKPVTDALFAGQPMGDRFKLARSRVATLRASDPTLDNEDILEDWGVGVPDCDADFDRNSQVEVPDIFAFLSAWFAHEPAANFDHVNGIEVPDIFAFLAAWFRGC